MKPERLLLLLFCLLLTHNSKGQKKISFEAEVGSGFLLTANKIPATTTIWGEVKLKYKYLDLSFRHQRALFAIGDDRPQIISEVVQEDSYELRETVGIRVQDDKLFSGHFSNQLWLNVKLTKSYPIWSVGLGGIHDYFDSSSITTSTINGSISTETLASYSSFKLGYRVGWQLYNFKWSVDYRREDFEDDRARIYGASHDHLVSLSLGYIINPKLQREPISIERNRLLLRLEVGGGLAKDFAFQNNALAGGLHATLYLRAMRARLFYKFGASIITNIGVDRNKSQDIEENFQNYVAQPSNLENIAEYSVEYMKLINRFDRLNYFYGAGIAYYRHHDRKENFFGPKASAGFILGAVSNSLELNFPIGLAPYVSYKIAMGINVRPKYKYEKQDVDESYDEWIKKI